MKIIFSLSFILLWNAAQVFCFNQNMKNSIENKILNDLNLISSINKSSLIYDILDKNSIPDYKLYEIRILNRDFYENNINYILKINNFINPNEYKIIEVDVSTGLVCKINKKLKLHNKIKILYKNNGIEIYDIGIIQSIKSTDEITVKNSFGKLMDCKLISDKLAEAEAD